MNGLEFFRPDHRHQQVSEEQECNNGRDNGFHLRALKFVAEANVRGAQEEEQNHGSDESQIAHTPRKDDCTNTGLRFRNWPCIAGNLRGRRAGGAGRVSQNREYNQLTAVMTINAPITNRLINGYKFHPHCRLELVKPLSETVKNSLKFG